MYSAEECLVRPASAGNITLIRVIIEYSVNIRLPDSIEAGFMGRFFRKPPSMFSTDYPRVDTGI
jgi:hypothetical protein